MCINDSITLNIGFIIDYAIIYIYIIIIISEFRHDQGNRRSAMLI